MQSWCLSSAHSTVAHTVVCESMTTCYSSCSSTRDCFLLHMETSRKINTLNNVLPVHWPFYLKLKKYCKLLTFGEYMFASIYTHWQFVEVPIFCKIKFTLCFQLWLKTAGQTQDGISYCNYKLLFSGYCLNIHYKDSDTHLQKFKQCAGSKDNCGNVKKGPHNWFCSPIF